MPSHQIAGALAGATATATAAAALALALAAAPACLADTIATTAPTAATVPAIGTSVVPGASVTDATNNAQTLLVSVSTTLGSLSLSETSGLTLAYGYSSFIGPTLSFTGTPAAVDMALATLSLAGAGAPGTASISVTATADQAGIAYLPSDGHYYEFVANTSDSWTQAQTDANALTFDGQEGYLATIPDATVNDFLLAHLDGAQDVWAGGSSTDYPSANGPGGSSRLWSWAGSPTPGDVPYGGPLAGNEFTECTNVSGNCAFTNTNSFFAGAWHSGYGDQEPNNSGYSGPGTGEHYLEINYTGIGGGWNDISATASVAGYVVAFGDQTIGASSWTGESTSTAAVATANAPDAPTGVTVAGTSDAGGEATVSWTAPADDGGAAITGYTVTAIPADGSQASATCTATTSTRCTLTGLTDGVTYRFTVTAANPVGSADAPSVSDEVTQASVAPSPTPTPTPTPSPTPTPAPVPAPSPTPSACPAPSGSVSAGGVGPLTLGMTRSAARAALTDHHATANGFDDFCLTGTWGIRVAYGSPTMLGRPTATARSAVVGRIVIALTANPYFEIDGIRPGTSFALARRSLRLDDAVAVGANDWYVVTGRSSSWVLKERGGVIDEVGVAVRALTATAAARRTFLHHL